MAHNLYIICRGISEVSMILYFDITCQAFSVKCSIPCSETIGSDSVH